MIKHTSSPAVEKRRRRYEIAADILETAQQPARVTRIVYDCNLNFVLIRRYLDHLLECGLIRRIH